MAEDPAEIIKGLQNIKAIDAPSFYVNASQVYFVRNDFIVVLARNRPATADGWDPAKGAIGMQENSAIIQCSAGTMKDLCLALQSQIALYEAQFGEIVTEFSRSQSAKK